MKKPIQLILLVMTVVVVGCSGNVEEAQPPSELAYLGQTPPGTTAEIFAPGIVNTAENREIEGMFGGDMNAFYFIKRPQDQESDANMLTVIELKDNQWKESSILQGVSEPSFSPDGATIYFANEYIERVGDGWSNIESLGAPFGEIAIMRLSAAANGTMYFDTFTPDLKMPLRSSRLIDGTYEAPKSLGPQFAIGTYNAHPFVAPDESYIVFDSRRDGGYGSSDLYISYRMSNGSWGPAINLGDKINTADAENYPTVSPDGNFLFFDRRGEALENGERPVDIYWVNTQFIDALRPQN